MFEMWDSLFYFCHWFFSWCLDNTSLLLLTKQIRNIMIIVLLQDKKQRIWRKEYIFYNYVKNSHNIKTVYYCISNYFFRHFFKNIIVNIIKPINTLCNALMLLPQNKYCKRYVTFFPQFNFLIVLNSTFIY